MIEAIKFMVKRWYYGRRFKKSAWMAIPRRNRVLMYMFLTQWLYWVENGAGKHSVFTRDASLCVAWERWRLRYYEYRLPLSSYMLDMLRVSFDSPSFPFGGHARYRKEHNDACMHLNAKRVTWAKKMVKIYWDGESFGDGEDRS